MKFKYENLNVWKISMQLVKKIYKLTDKFPKSEMYGLTSQIRRSAISIPLNIAEGSGKKSPKEFSQFLRIAISSLLEADTACKIAVNLNFIKIENLNELNQLFQEIYFKLIALEKSIKK
jgi:four helix bundle protein